MATARELGAGTRELLGDAWGTLGDVSSNLPPAVVSRAVREQGGDFLSGLLALEQAKQGARYPSYPPIIPGEKYLPLGVNPVTEQGVGVLPTTAAPAPISTADLLKHYGITGGDTVSGSRSGSVGGGASIADLAGILKQQRGLYKQQEGQRAPTMETSDLRGEAQKVYAANPELVRGAPNNEWSFDTALNNFLAHGTAPAMAGKDLTEGLAAAGKVRGDMEERNYQELLKAREAKIAQQLGLVDLGGKDRESRNQKSKYESDFTQTGLSNLMRNLQGQESTASNIAKTKMEGARISESARQHQAANSKENQRIIAALTMQGDIATAQKAGDKDRVAQLTSVYNAVFKPQKAEMTPYEKVSEEELAKYVAEARANNQPFKPSEIPMLRQGGVPRWTPTGYEFDFPSAPAKR